jgi:hypothetical protein
VRILDFLVAVGEPLVRGEVTTARRVYSPSFHLRRSGDLETADSDSSSCAKLSGTLAGVAFQPAGSSSDDGLRRALGSIGHRDVNLALTGFARCAACGAGITASGGVTLTENAGTTFSSIRLSPV